MQCPVCGVIADGNHFEYIGSGKRICSSCQSILNVGYLCPVCDSYTMISPGISPPTTIIAKFLSRIKFTFDTGLTCDNCGYHASHRLFPRILYQNEKYSLIE